MTHGYIGGRLKPPPRQALYGGGAGGGAVRVGLWAMWDLMEDEGVLAAWYSPRAHARYVCAP